MPDKPEKFFLVVYDLGNQDVHVHEYDSDFDEAASNYAMFERRYADQPLTEVVLLGADSIETIKKTHSHYFARVADDLFEQLITDLETV